MPGVTTKRQRGSRSFDASDVRAFSVPRRIDYSDPAVMAARRAAALTRRETRGAYVLGDWVERDGELVLRAVARNVVTNMPVIDEMTTQLKEMMGWASRQSAHQFAGRNKLAVRVIHVPMFSLEVDETSSGPHSACAGGVDETSSDLQRRRDDIRSMPIGVLNERAYYLAMCARSV